MHLIDPTYFIY